MSSESFRELEQEMIATGVGFLTVIRAFGNEELGRVHLGREQTGILYIEPDGFSRESGCELYAAYFWRVGEPS